MKIICAWCGQLLGYKCPFCGVPLEKVILDRRVWYRCTEPMTQIYFNPDTMKETHEICGACAQLTDDARREARQNRHEQLSLDDQQTIAALDGAGNRGPGNFKTKERNHA